MSPRPTDSDVESILWDIAVRKGATECGQPTSSYRFAPCILPPDHRGQAHKSRFDDLRIIDRVNERSKNNEEIAMHYRNGREAKNGDKIVQLGYDGKVLGFGILHDAVAGNDYCNGCVAPISGGTVACLIDCLHVDDIIAMLAEKGLDKRPAGK